MTCSSADLLRQWRAEREDLEQAINDLQTGETGAALAPGHRQAAINRHTTALADIDSLIADFSLCEPFPIMFDPADALAEPIVMRRFDSLGTG